MFLLEHVLTPRALSPLGFIAYLIDKLPTKAASPLKAGLCLTCCFSCSCHLMAGVGIHVRLFALIINAFFSFLKNNFIEI